MKSEFTFDESQALLAATISGELPDKRGRFGPFGGRYVPETLVPAFERLEQGIAEHLHTKSFQDDYARELREWVGRPTALSFAPRLSERWGAEVWLKREDLAHTGAHKINNAIGQALLAGTVSPSRHPKIGGKAEGYREYLNHLWTERTRDSLATFVEG